MIAADAAFFGFEGEAEVGGLTSLVQTDSGLTLTISRSTGLTFGIQDVQGFVPSWGNRALSPFANSSANDYFVGNFSSAVSYVTLRGGDGGGDPDILELEAYSGLDGTGTLIDLDSADYGTNGFPADIGVSVAGAGIQSIRFRGGSGHDPNWQYPNSMYIDNITTTPVPEPVTLGLGIGALAAAARRRRGSAAGI
ncbi:MAG: hypothetical protein M9921_11380 [Fimbriimonadaceae bacterium]|nr:hypothetical protein [Chthonomonadaceae bacterium]MCO5297448.1 hypothetical protein [Fimbriimonadaceae bacterium]